MLESISWKEYWMLVVGAVAFYYGWWAIKYRGGLARRGRKAKASAADNRLTMLYAELSADGMKVAAARTEPGKEVHIIKEEPVMQAAAVVDGLQEPVSVPAVVEPESGDFLSVVAAALLKKVAVLLERAAREGMDEEGLAAELGELMRQGPYCRLKGTDYQEKVSDEIVRVLTSFGSIALDAERVRGLWDG